MQRCQRPVTSIKWATPALADIHDATNHDAGEYSLDHMGRSSSRSQEEIFGRPFVKRFAIGPLSVLSVCNVGVLWPNGWTDQDETWHAGRPRPGHIVLGGDRLPLP